MDPKWLFLYAAFVTCAFIVGGSIKSCHENMPKQECECLCE